LIQTIGWSPPFRVDISRALKPGANQLEVEVHPEPSSINPNQPRMAFCRGTPAKPGGNSRPPFLH
jgi:hypothetical protein